MTIDYTRLAPWRILPAQEYFRGSPLLWVVCADSDDSAVQPRYDRGNRVAYFFDRADAELACRLAAAEEIVRRRGLIASHEHLWGDPAKRNQKAWIVRYPRTTESIVKGGTAYELTIGPTVGELGSRLIWSDDQATALIAADAWLTARERENGDV